MKHEALNEEEIAKSGLMQEGIYDFTIIEATEAQSKSGNDMFKLKLHVFDTDGAAKIIFDWILPSFPKKFKHIHDACGLLDVYARGDTKPNDLIDKSGKLQLGVGKPYIGNDGFEKVNNTVLDYVKRDNLVQESKAAPLPKDVADDVIDF